MNWDQPASPAPDDSAPSPEVASSTTPSPTDTTTTDAIAASDSELSNVDAPGSLLGDFAGTGRAPTPGPASQARSSLAGAISHGSAAQAMVASAPATRPTTPVTATSSASLAAAGLAAAVGQSFYGGIRPMTMAPQRTGILRPGGPHTSGSMSPDTGSGGGNEDLPPILTSTTFDINELNPVSDPGVYQPDPANMIPIGASVVLTATSPYGQDNPITTWDWSGGTNYENYFSTPANQTSQDSQDAPIAPDPSAETYGFIVDSTTPQLYGVNVNVAYALGGKSSAELLFQSDAPTGSLAIKQLGTQTFSTTTIPGYVTILLSPGIDISATASTDNYTAGQFMFMQIINTNYRQYTNFNGNIS